MSFEAKFWTFEGIFSIISLIGFAMWGTSPSTNPTALPDEWYPMVVLGIGFTGLLAGAVYMFRRALKEIRDERNQRAASDS